MNSLVEFFTDTATLAIFDPIRLKHRVTGASDWWCENFLELEEVRSGAIALLSLGGDGVFRARITDGHLTPDERDYAAEVVRGLGLEVTSNAVYVGPGECLPGGGFALPDLKRGIMLEMKNGAYNVDAYAIEWSDSPRWWNEEHTIREDAPTDFVLVIQCRSSPFRQPDSEPRFSGVDDRFLFDSPARRVGPEPGMLLTTSVRKGPSGLTLKDCGPRYYQATLVDYSSVKWKDRIRFEVLSVDHKSRLITGKFIELLPPAKP
jgi:hypothetical protein